MCCCYVGFIFPLLHQVLQDLHVPLLPVDTKGVDDDGRLTSGQVDLTKLLQQVCDCTTQQKEIHTYTPNSNTYTPTHPATHIHNILI